MKILQQNIENSDEKCYLLPVFEHVIFDLNDSLNCIHLLIELNDQKNHEFDPIIFLLSSLYIKRVLILLF